MRSAPAILEGRDTEPRDGEDAALVASDAATIMVLARG
jgi:hypothetical protein